MAVSLQLCAPPSVDKKTDFSVPRSWELRPLESLRGPGLRPDLCLGVVWFQDHTLTPFVDLTLFSPQAPENPSSSPWALPLGFSVVPLTKEFPNLPVMALMSLCARGLGSPRGLFCFVWRENSGGLNLGLTDTPPFLHPPQRSPEAL